MSYEVGPGDIFGRVGTGLGQGLKEQIPKEVERHRLASGLKDLGNQKGLSPFQSFAGLAATPGVTPQMLQSGSELLRQQAYLDAIKNQYGNQNGPQSTGYSPNQEDFSTPVKGEIPSLADPLSTQQSYKNYIPPTEQEERRDAYENFQKNPARYGYDFENALSERKAITARNQEIQKAYQGQESTAVAKETTVKDALDKEKVKLGLDSIPPKAYQQFEEKVLNAVLSKGDGGEGLTQEQAIKKYSKELNQADRNYKDLGSLSTWSPMDFDRRVNALQKDFSSRGENQMMMDQLISDYQVSPTYAAHLSYPLTQSQKSQINKIRDQPFGTSFPINNKTYAELKNSMGKTGSPLSIAYELQRKGRDPREWLDYLNNNRDDLQVWQADQLTKNINILPLKDIWLGIWEKSK